MSLISAIEISIGMAVILSATEIVADRVMEVGMLSDHVVGVLFFLIFLICWVAAAIYYLSKAQPTLKGGVQLWVICWTFFWSEQAVLFVAWPSFPGLIGLPGSLRLAVWSAALTLTSTLLIAVLLNRVKQ